MSNKWIGVIGFENHYEVSDSGHIRSRDRVVPNKLTGGTSVIKGRILKGRVNRGGYIQVTLSVNQKNTTKTVHRLVAEAHIPNPDNLPLVLHGPKGKLDNSTANLRWGTNSDNMYDKRRDGTDHEVNKTHCPQRHEYTPDNTVLDNGSRRCLTCIRERSRKSYWRKRNGEIQKRLVLGLPEKQEVPRCETCGRFLGSKHQCRKGYE